MIPAGKVERGERKQTASEASKADWVTSNPEGDASTRRIGTFATPNSAT
jgi:hypothetical protein